MHRPVVWRVAHSVTSLLGVCTTRAGQTSTSWATSLAWSLAATRSVVLVDCDMEGGTIADLLYLRLDDRCLANCLGGRPVTATALAAQTIAVPDRPGLRVIPGLRSSYGFEIAECLRTIAPALGELACDAVVVDLGHPWAHPGLRSPRAAADAVCSAFHRVFIVVRDEPALLSRSIDVLRTARPPHGELLICEQRGAAHRRVMVETIERELPDLTIRRGWEWDERRAARMADSGRPITLAGVEAELHL
jgi:MinD-like ATPase involved in chromosome partitioning or flagellar assembly